MANSGYVRSRQQRGRHAAVADMDSWATGGMNGSVHLLRNPGVIVANIIAQQSLQQHLWDLAVERQRCLYQRDYERKAFLERLKMKGGPLRDVAKDLELGKRPRYGARCRSACSPSRPSSCRPRARSAAVHSRHLNNASSLTIKPIQIKKLANGDCRSSENPAVHVTDEAKPSELPRRSRRLNGPGYTKKTHPANDVQATPGDRPVEAEYEPYMVVMTKCDNGQIRPQLVPVETACRASRNRPTHLPTDGERSSVAPPVKRVAVLRPQSHTAVGPRRHSLSGLPSQQRAASARAIGSRTAAGDVDETVVEMSRLIESVDSLHVPSREKILLEAQAKLPNTTHVQL